jgi:hypothetical protein
MGEEVLEEVIAVLHEDAEGSTEDGSTGELVDAESAVPSIALSDDAPNRVLPVDEFLPTKPGLELDDEGMGGSAMDLPDPAVPPPDTDTVQPLKAGELNPKNTPAGSVRAEPGHVHDPNTVIVDTLRADTPPILPDPSLPPVDSTRPLPVELGDYVPLPNSSPSSIAEAEDESMQAVDIEADSLSVPSSPVLLPDPYEEPEDSTLPAFAAPLDLPSSSRPPSLVVEVETPAELSELVSPTIADAIPTPESPTMLPDPKAPPPDTDRIMPEVDEAKKMQAPDTFSVLAAVGVNMTESELDEELNDPSLLPPSTPSATRYIARSTAKVEPWATGIEPDEAENYQGSSGVSRKEEEPAVFAIPQLVADFDSEQLDQCYSS